VSSPSKNKKTPLIGGVCPFDHYFLDVTRFGKNFDLSTLVAADLTLLVST
jgi:hypothetical protein